MRKLPNDQHGRATFDVVAAGFPVDVEDGSRDE